jgi:ElaB/YqjD/DUF883 family membrane-anchored ribosome-binding protein
MTPDTPSDAERSNEAQGTGNDNAFARLEQEMAKMRDAIGGLSDQISDAASDFGSVAQEQARRGLKHARANVGSMVNDASDRLGVVANTAQSQASSLGDTLEDAIQDRPLSTLALALGLGFLAGVIWRR